MAKNGPNDERADGWSRRKLLLGGAAALGGAVALTPPLICAAPSGALRRRALVVYYSRSGNTGTVAEMIAERMSSAMVRVESVPPYPQDYEATVERARVERDSGRYPEIRPRIPDLRAYDMLFLGSPIWGDHLNPPMKRFLADHDLSGITIAPFVTYKVSVRGQVEHNIHALAPKAKLVETLPIFGEHAQRAGAAVDDWLCQIKMC
jgi:flavodoxin